MIDPQEFSRLQEQLPEESKPSSRLREIFSILFKSSGLIVWFVIFILALLELKRYYNIDIVPGYNSSLDDAYGAMRGGLSELFD